MAQQSGGGGQARARGGLDLNSASEEELAGVKQIGAERAVSIVENRPFDDWDDLKELPGFSDRLIEDLKSAGFTIEPEE
jgi:DNA uptake protein ComE-like DNA-binding protein